MKTLFLTLCLILISFSAYAINPAFLAAVSGQGGGGVTCTELGANTSSTVIDLDATCSNSYSGSGQTWSNIESSPADGSSQTAGDFYLGDDGTADGADPTFVTDYFEFDGDDYLTHTDGVGSPNVPTIRDMPKDTSGTVWWVAMTLTTSSSLSNQRWFGNGTDSGSIGVSFANFGTGSDDLGTFHRVGASNTSLNMIADAITTSTRHLVIVSWDMFSTTNNGRIWVDTTTKTEVSKNWLTNTDDTNGVLRIGASDNQGTADTVIPFDSGVKLYSFAMGNAYLDDSDVSTLVSDICARHNYNYTGSCL